MWIVKIGMLSPWWCFKKTVLLQFAHVRLTVNKFWMVFLVFISLSAYSRCRCGFISFWLLFLFSLHRKLLNLNDDEFLLLLKLTLKSFFHRVVYIHMNNIYTHRIRTVTSKLIGLFTFLRRMHSIYVQNFRNLFYSSLKTFSNVNFQ